MNQNDYYSNSNDYINRWVISYADFITMLLALFMVLYAASSMGASKVKDVNKSLEKVFVTQSQNAPEKLADEEALNPSDKEILPPELIMKELKANSELDDSVIFFKEKRGIVIRLNDNMLFDLGSAIIKPEAKAELDKVARTLSTFENPVVIEGHTDSSPIRTEKYPSNWELSTARATNIISYLTQRYEFTAGRFSAVGYGEFMPVASNDSQEGKAKNRRVDIIILSSDNKQ